jgi:hypothetical protein
MSSCKSKNWFREVERAYLQGIRFIGAGVIFTHGQMVVGSADIGLVVLWLPLEPGDEKRYC